MSEFRFAEPQWVHALWAVLAFAALLAVTERSAVRALERLVAPALRSRLVNRATPGQRRVRLALLTLTGLFGVLALMRPQWGLEFVATPRASAELIVAIDVSRSMLAEDVVPNRLERAKAEVRDLLGFLEGDHVGLIAFAGRASVLAPLTPDFGFFRLVLDELGPHSVTLGGTRLEEPIRKAVAGFRATGDISRVILLISDGEDHDSFPLAAAREAAERGIAVIAIGLGSASGSEIPVVDPVTGARSLVRDPEGRAVRSRLDDAVLRDIARLTGGAYIPAGTGVLDLESIYNAHIAGLMRGKIAGAGRPLRTEGFQWLVLASLLCLIGAVLLGRAREVAVAALAVSLLASPAVLWAQDAPGEPSPREAYNLGLEKLEERDLEEAERLFELARTRAGSDGEAHYRATYGLGWAEAAGADARLESEPAGALASLRLAADRFRASLRLRPGSEDARHNLEVVLQRARVLEDSLREQDASSLAESLDELSQRQRELVAGVRVSLALDDATDEPGQRGLRERLRELSSRQRLILSDGDALAARADGERGQIEATPPEERQPEERLRAVQLDQLLQYLRRARERMGHARRELRRQRPERAHRRASVALDELKRARDQLRDPVQVLDALIAGALELGAYTRLYATSGSALPGSDRVQERPAWLSAAYLGDALAVAAERSRELGARFSAGLAQGAAPVELEVEGARLLAAVEEALPLVRTATWGLERARDAIGRDAALEALAGERDAVAALSAARELFLDLRGLIEASHADQQRLSAALDSEVEEPQQPASEIARALRGVQWTNLGRSERIASLLDEDLAALPPEESDEEAQAQRERFLLAKRLVTLSETAMRDTIEELGMKRPELGRAARPAARALQSLEALRRLFFSIVERLRDTARRQLELNDATEQAVALEDPVPALGPLIPRQAKLADTVGKLAGALEEQSRRPPGDAPGGAQEGLSPEAQQEMTDRLRRAAELVLAAQSPLQTAAEELAAEELEDVRGKQDQALSHLLEAVALLTPPEADRGEGGQQGQDPSAESGAGGESARQEQPPVVDPSQLLQEVRDREARRRRERERDRRRSASAETVEKDW
ncbi:MAG: VWA domain-containing protein [Myxococcota bacterium]